MFEASELGHEIDKEQYEREVPELRAKLLEAQYAVKENGTFPVIVLIAGVDGAGKGETVNVLNDWMDPRHIRTIAFDDPTDEELERPRMWRYWRALPPKGRIGILFGSWYSDPIVERVFRRSRRSDLDGAVVEIRRFEEMLSAEGALIVKFWFHLSKKDQEERLREIDRDKKRTWRVTRADWKQFKKYDDYYAVSEHVVRLTSTGDAPWIVVEGKDRRYRELTAGRTLLGAIERHLEVDPKVRAATQRRRSAEIVRPIDGRDVITELDLSVSMPPEQYDDELEKWQGELNRLSRRPRFREIGVVAAFEGMDAAGKGGAIRRVTGALDARQYRVIPVAAPTEDERAQPYLWRFWRDLPRKGRLTLYDRTWYGRVLVERVEGYCSEPDWMRAYDEINDFEEQLCQSRTVLVKFWLQISEEEQLKRFKGRESTQFKHYKITEDDWRNRKKWAAYQSAAADMVQRTSTDIAPWTLVPANDKYFARIKVLKTIVKRIEQALDDLPEKD
jgi:polyphosphate:AMP phosphotransferase